MHITHCWPLKLWCIAKSQCESSVLGGGRCLLASEGCWENCKAFSFVLVTNISFTEYVFKCTGLNRKKGKALEDKALRNNLIHFSYIRSRYKAFQNISSMLVSCRWFTGCDRKSISVPVDAKFITLPQNSDSPLLLELQLAAMATSARQYIFSFPLFSIGTDAYCSKNSILLQY